MVFSMFITFCNHYHQLSPGFFYLAKVTPYIHLTSTSHFPFCPAPGNCHPTSCIYEFDYSKYLIVVQVEFSISDLSFCDWLILLNIMSSEFISVAACVIILFIHLLMDSWVDSTSWLLLKVLLSKSSLTHIWPKYILWSTLLWCLPHGSMRLFLFYFFAKSVSYLPLFPHDIEVCLAHMRCTANIFNEWHWNRWMDGWMDEWVDR